MTTPLGKYKLVKLIAAGGMAEVYLAKQAGAAGFEKQVCLKRILPHLARDKQFVDMFLNEARLAAQLDHPNIVSIFDLGEANGNYFIAMEFIDGPNLRTVARRAAELNELLPIPEVLKIVASAAAGLQYAHDLADKDGNPLGLVHRDISPDNILVHRNGTAKVVDFGIAKAAGSSGQTRTGTLKGKVAYMPPEQLRGEPLDRRTDVFALGVVLYELLGGKRPWEGSSEVALIGKIMTEEPAPLDELRSDASADLVAVVQKALSKDRDTRYQNCNELQHDLEQLIVGLGQSITSTRIADFVRAYAPPTETAPEGTDAQLDSVQDETFGTGAAPAIMGPQAPALAQTGAEGTDAGTLMMPAGAVAPPPRTRTFLYGAVAFLAIVVIGSGGAMLVLHGQGNNNDDSSPVAVERAAVGEPPKPPPAPPPVVVDPTPPPAVADPVPQERPRPQPRRVVRADPEPAAPVVIVKDPPKPIMVPVLAAPAITAKGELVLLIRPWARVEVDGREVGVTPLDAIKLTVGDHQVRLINPDLGKDVVRTVHITASEKEVLKEILDE